MDEILRIITKEKPNHGKLLALLVFILPLALFLKTLAHTYLPPDSAEFALCINSWGVCHPPGFPLYTAIGKLFTTIFPIGTLIFKVNLLSALFGAGAIFLFYLILRQLEIDSTLAFLLSLFLSVTPVFWSLSVVADVFTFGTFLLTATLYFVFKNRLFLACLFLGLLTSHFYISALLLPIFLWYFKKGEKDRFRLATGAVFFILGLSPQALMYSRMMADPSVNWGHVQNLWDFVDFVRRKEFGSFFIVSNSSSVFSPAKLIGHFDIYFKSLLKNFAFILPILTPIALSLANRLKSKKVRLLISSYFILLVVSLFTLSSLNPYEQHSPFNFSKFYLSSFVIFTLLLGISLQTVKNKFAKYPYFYHALIIALVGLIVTTAWTNYPKVDLSDNNYSQSLISDALGQLPVGSIAIFINHQLYFGSLYEQTISHRFPNIKLVYYPNDSNQDAPKYHPELFESNIDTGLKNQIEKGKELTPVQRHILDLIVRNSKQNIFILQGTYEDLVFGYLKPYIKPYGLWWQLKTDINFMDNSSHITDLFKNITNQETDRSKLKINELQYLEPFVYAYGYFYSGVQLAQNGMYDQSLDFLRKSRGLSDNPSLIDQSINLISSTKNLESRKDVFLQNADRDNLTILAASYFNIGNYQAAADIFSAVTRISPNDATAFNNLASSYASLGRKNEAIVNYQKAISINPQLQTAIDGLSKVLK